MGLMPTRELRRVRYRRRLRTGLDKSTFDLLYRWYLILLGFVLILGYLVSLLRQGRASPTQVTDALRYGPPTVGLAVAVALILGARTGRRGGPLVFEVPDVHHVLLAPLPRRRVILPAAVRIVAAWASLGLLIGIGAGLVASLRLAGGHPAWMASGGLAGLSARVRRRGPWPLWLEAGT